MRQNTKDDTDRYTVGRLLTEFCDDLDKDELVRRSFA